MSAFSDYMEQSILNWVKGTAFPSAPAGVYVGLFSSNPTDAGSGTEVTTSIRPAGRVAASFGSISSSGTGGAISNSSAIDFGASSNAVTVSHFGLYDAASSGNLIMYGALTASKTLAVGDEAKFNTGDLTLTVA